MINTMAGTQVEQDALTAFEASCQLAGLSADSVPEVWEAIRMNYTRPTRHYHTLQHLLSMFAFLEGAALAGHALHRPAAVHFATWLHDLVYEAASSTNEEDSAQLASALLSPHLPPDTVARVGQLVGVGEGQSDDP